MAIHSSLQQKQKDSLIESTSTGGQAGQVVVNPDGSNIGGFTSATDEASFTEGSTSASLMAGVFNDSLGAVTSGLLAALRMTAFRALHINLRNASGTEIGTSANPVQVTQAALLVGVDTVSAGPMVAYSAVITGSGAAQQLVAAPAANTHIRLWKCIVSNANGVTCVAGILNGSGGTLHNAVDLSANIGDKASIGPTQGYLPLTGGGTPTGLYTSAITATGSPHVTYTVYYTIVADNSTDTTAAALW